jgi:hypothetical protein
MVIEQYTIATTPRYNFPNPTMDSTLPQRFIEQSIISLKQVQNRAFQLNQQIIQQNDTSEMQTYGLSLNPRPIPLSPKRQATTIAACDTSTIKIGETSTGVLVAIRGANVWRQNKSYRYIRLGPFIFHLTVESKSEVYNALERSCFGTSNDGNHQNISIWQMPMRIAGLLERWLQSMLASMVSNGLILFDGSLTAGVGGVSTRGLKQILVRASENNNIVLAFSKMTNLRADGHIITDVPFELRPPCLLETIGLKPKPPITLLGDVFVAKLTCEDYAFRLDISKDLSLEQKVEAVERLLGNDVISQSYPETLRLAHILCTFTANEVLAMQHFAVRKYGLKLVNRPDMHKLLFGPFGRGEICS